MRYGKGDSWAIFNLFVFFLPHSFPLRVCNLHLQVLFFVLCVLLELAQGLGLRALLVGESLLGGDLRGEADS